MEKQIQEINSHIKAALNEWSDICLKSEADQWAYQLNYNDMDVMNVCYLFQHVCSNIGIKAGFINEKNTVEFGNRLHDLVMDMTGVDTRHVFDEKQSIEHGKEQETSSNGNSHLSE
jgi:hypothetical protein